MANSNNNSTNNSINGTEYSPEWIQELVETEGNFESPIDINLAKAFPLQLPLLSWHNYDLSPKKMKLTNTGHTLILSAKWHQERPFLSDGPLLGNYVFSQLHFHWGCNDMEGSEHTVDGTRHPLEMHVVHFKSCYLTQEAALKEKDGIVVLAFFFKLQSAPNPSIQVLADAIPFIQKPHCSARLDPLPLSFLLKPFEADYFLYWGSVTTSTCIHVILWLLSREPIGVSAAQVEVFRSLLDTNEEPLIRNFRAIQPMSQRKLFHVCPSTSQYSTLLPLPRNLEPQNSYGNYMGRSDSKQSQSYKSEQIYRADMIRCKSPFQKTRSERNEPSGRHVTKTRSAVKVNGQCCDISPKKRSIAKGGGGEARKHHEDRNRPTSPETSKKSPTSRNRHHN